MHTKEFGLTEKQAPTISESVGSWVISSANYDRVNDRIMTPALKSQTGRDVLCLWQHDTNQPVGKWAQLRMEGDKLVADLVLAKTNLGNMIRALLDVGTPLCASVGFKGKGKNNAKGGVDFSEISLLETSIVSVPCNADAMQIAKSFGYENLVSDESKSEAEKMSASAQEVVLKAKAAILSAQKTLRK